MIPWARRMRKRRPVLAERLRTCDAGALAEAGGFIALEAGDADPEEVALAAIDAGAEDVRVEGRLDTKAIEAGDLRILAFTGESYFTASHALFLEDYLRPVPEHGALLAVPHRHSVMFYPIVGTDAVHAVQTMLPAAFGMFHEGPGSISPDLYWWRRDRIVHLPSKMTAKQATFRPPEEFVEMLNGLGGGGTA